MVYLKLEPNLKARRSIEVKLKILEKVQVPSRPSEIDRKKKP